MAFISISSHLTNYGMSNTIIVLLAISGSLKSIVSQLVYCIEAASTYS